MTDQLSGGVVQPTDAQIDPLDDLHGLLFLAQRTEGDQREAAISNARIVLHKFREAMVAVPQAPLQAEPVPVVASEPSDLAPFTSPDADLNALLDAVVWFAKGPDFNNMDTGIYMMECLQTVLDRLATPQAEPAVAEQARDVLRKVVHYGNCMAAGNIMAAEAAMSSVETALTSQSTPQAIPEGCTPADAALLREANHALADESRRLQAVLADLLSQVKTFCERNGEADFETGDAARLLHSLSPLDFPHAAVASTPPPAAEQAQGLADSGESA